MVSQAKLIKQGIYLTDSLFDEIIKRLSKGVKSSDTLEVFLNKTKDYTMNNPLVISGYKDELLEIILKETNNHKFSRPAQKELTRLTIENRVGDLIVDVGEDVKNNVRDIVKHGYNNGLSQDEIAENISHRVTTIKNTRARTIARTEIARTATASDYVINKERGATHFKVDCRDTCCDICRKDYNFGKVEYTIDQVEMLPPRHPNCRCYTMFFIKEDEISNALKLKDNSNISNRFRDEENFSNMNGRVNDDTWTKEGIQKTLEGFVDADEVESVSEAILDFIKDARDNSNEGATTYDSEFNPVSKFIAGESERYIDIPTDDVNAVKNSYFGIVGHSHTKSKIPLPGCEDIKVGILNLKVKYNIIYAPGYGVTIIKKDDPKNKPDKNKIKDAFGKADEKRKKYVKTNTEKNTEDYKKKVNYGNDVSSIEYSNSLESIVDDTKHSNLKEQCEFYNDELKPYGIELRYITP